MPNRFLRKILFTACIFTACSISLHAQQRFKAGVIAGLNASQILGDDTGGYNRLGIQGGLRAIAILTDRTDLNIEILYSQRGSHENVGIHPCSLEPLDIALQYIEVPVLFTIKDWLSDDEEYYRIQASGGLSYGRLINATAEGSCHDGLTDLFNQNDISFTAGAEYFATKNLTIGIRWSRSFNLLYNRKKGDEIGRFENSLRGFFLSFRVGYIF